MIIRQMRRDQLDRFAKCLIDNGDGTFSLRITDGSNIGLNASSSSRSDTMKAFDKTITSDSVRTFNG